MNTFIWGFEGESGTRIVETISGDKSFNVVVWISDSKNCTHNVFDFILAKDNIHSERPYNIECFAKCYQEGLNSFINMFTRHFHSYARTYHDFIDAFNILFQKIYSLTIENKTELVIFSNIPHEGPDFISYLIAKELGIKTLMLFQAPVAKDNRFFILREISDFETLENIGQIEKFALQKIEKTHVGTYFYMRNLKILNEESLAQNWLLYLKLLLKRDFWTLSLSVSKHLRYRSFQHRVFALSKKIDWKNDLKFVYFPLAMQPELTTSALGGIFNDQMLAIERLSHLLPEDWKVIVKENPKQTDMQRGEWFFSRLSHLRNVILIDPHESSHFLIEKSQFVAVVTGTAGWEAIKGGKKALVFGFAWFMSLPGVIKYHESLTFDSILSYSFTHEELEIAYSRLLSKVVRGVVDPLYIDGDVTFNSDSNAQHVLNCLKRFI
ncbi:MAG: hypothetical protein U1F40_12475 [Turneriella sp.]